MFLKKIDIYIIKKFLGTYFLSIALIISIAVIFDITEKLDDFFEHNAPLSAIVFDYYLNFIPYFANLFSPLFVFISVIFFTSKMAENTEIIAILAGGVSFRRMMFPYFISALIVAAMTFYLSSYVIPEDNRVRLEFSDQYIKKKSSDYARNVQMEVEPNVVMYLERYEDSRKKGYGFSLEKFDRKKLVSRMTAGSIEYDSLNNWHIENYIIRTFDGLSEKLTKGDKIDSVINMQPADFLINPGMQEQMSLSELNAYLKKQKSRGIGNIKEFELEYHRRFAFPLAAFILTLIGVSLSSQKKRGGMGINIGFGILLSFSYIMFSTISSTFSLNGNMPPILAMWIPNFIYLPIGIILYMRAPK
ncbi:MAG: LptF/LptG family permease [Prevotellaceae bacterium]|jgi:lipopolysaccharide export system permease protein|nr:LptF/LptG family permease [Prevotellaceae bacterium]